MDFYYIINMCQMLILSSYYDFETIVMLNKCLQETLIF